MKILFIIHGSGDAFYCGNCFRDNLHANALRKAGHEVVIFPLYLPLDKKTIQYNSPLFFPATTLYLAHKLFKNRKMPQWLQKLTGTKLMLKMASSLSGTTSAKGMEDMTLSMINGDDKVFLEHAEQLCEWVKQENPDVVHLSSTLVIGIAKHLKSKLNVPIICSAQDEEIWINGLKENEQKQAWQAIEKNSAFVDQFVTSSNFYKEVFRNRFQNIKNIEVVYPGIEIEKYASDLYPENPTIGFFYRMNKESGLDILVEAFLELKKRNSIPNLKLKIGGGFSGQDVKPLNMLKKKLQRYKNDVEILENYSVEDHANFYKTVSIISVPIIYDEGVGLYICEAFAAGRPVVEPATGSFPEIVENAGILYKNNNYNDLANAIETLLLNKSKYDECVENAIKLSQTRYNSAIAAQGLVAIYKNHINITNLTNN